MDNLNIHCRKSLTDFFGEDLGAALWKRLKVHYTPKHGSWLNQAEIEISLFSRQCLGKRRIPTLKILRRESRAWNRKVNRAGVKIHWQFHPQEGAGNVRLQKEPFNAVKDLANTGRSLGLPETRGRARGPLQCAVRLLSLTYRGCRLLRSETLRRAARLFSAISINSSTD